MQVGELWASLGIDDSAYRRGLNNAEGMGRRAAGAIGGAFKEALSFAGGMAIFEGVQAGLSGIATAGVQFNASMEQNTTAFTTMLGSAQAAGDYLNELYQFSAQTPFEFQEVTGAARRLQALGFQAKEVLPTLTAIGDAVSAMGGSSEMVDRVTMSLGQMKSKGTVQAEELLQLAEAGIPAYQILQEKLGLTADQVRNIGKEGISSSVAINALLSGMEERFGGAMAAQARTFNGRLSTFKDNFKRFLGEISGPLFDTLSNTILPKMSGMVAQLSQAFQQGGFRGIMEQLIPPGVLAAIDSLVAGLQKAFDIIKRLAPLIASFATAFVAWKSVVGIINAVSAAFSALNWPIVIIGALIAIAFALYSAWHTNLGGIRDRIEDLWNAFKDWLNNIQEKAGPVGDFFKKVWDVAFGFLKGLLENAITGWMRLFKVVSGVLEMIRTGKFDFGALKEEVLGTSFSFDNTKGEGNENVLTPKKIGGTISKMGQGIASGAGSLIDAMGKTFNDLMGGIFNAIGIAPIFGAKPDQPGAEGPSASGVGGEGTPPPSFWSTFATETGQGFKTMLTQQFQPVAGPLAIFGEILKAINPAGEIIAGMLESLAPVIEILKEPFQIIGRILGITLLPILKILNPILRGVATVFVWLAKMVAGIWNAFARAINWALDWLGVHLKTIDTSEYDKALKELTTDTNEQAKAADKASEALRNLPSGFKISTARWNATLPKYHSGGYVPTTGPALLKAGEQVLTPEQQRAGGSDSPIIIQGDIYGWDDFRRKVDEAEAQNKRKRNMAAVGLVGV